MMLTGGHAAQNERELRGFRWLWSGQYLNPIHFVPGSRIVQTKQELPWHPGSVLLPGIQFPPGPSVFRAIGFHPPYSAIGLKLRAATPSGQLHTGRKGFHIIPFDCSIVRMMLLADQPGSCVLDIYRAPMARMLTGQPPGPDDTLIREAEFRPTLDNAQSALDFTLYFWNTALHRNDVLCFDLLSFSGITALTLTLLVERNNQP